MPAIPSVSPLTSRVLGQTAYGKAVTIWRKQRDGTWKCVLDTWNGNPRPTVFDDREIAR